MLRRIVKESLQIGQKASVSQLIKISFQKESLLKHNKVYSVILFPKRRDTSSYH